ncbi:MAG: response regulator [Chloroflexi bacterium]|nr:response regulator [Chloroflexota bacterium]
MNPQTNLTGEFPVRVLIVDDHPTTAHTLARAVSQLGPKVNVISATSGREALERLDGSAADILITDMIMPDMNGIELVEKLQRHPGGRPAHIILITAYDVPGLKETARRAKVDEIIVKPVRPERICQIVTGLLEAWNRSTPQANEKPAAKPFKILIADDRPDNVTLLCRYIENEGYSYVTASDGEETLERTREHLPDLILLDVNMPKKDGFEVLAEIRADAALQHIPVIILTAARLDPVDIQSGLNLGADDYVTKPFDRRELMARIRTKLRVKEAEDHLLRQNRELSMLLEITAILNSREPLETMLDEVLQLIVQRLGTDSGYILDFSNFTARAFPNSAPKFDMSKVHAILQKNPHKSGGCIDQLTEHEPWREALGDSALSAIFVSMTNHLGGLLGAILLTHANYAYFKQEHIPILQAIANQAAVAMESAAWYAALQEKTV